MCLTLCNAMDCSLPRSSVHGILQARVLEWVLISFSKGSSQPRDWTWVSCMAGKFFTIWATIWCKIRKPQKSIRPRHTPLTSFLRVLPEIDYACANIKDVSCSYFLNAQYFTVKRTWHPLRYSYLENHMDRGAWWAIQPMALQRVHWTLMNWLSTDVVFHCVNVPQFIKSSIDEHFIFLGSKITADRDCSHEIKRRFLLGRKGATNLDSILKSRHHFANKIHIVKAIVSPVVMYGCESWTIKKAEPWRMDASKLQCRRRLLRVPWTAGRSNQSILKEINPECSLEGLMLKRKLQYFGHLIGRDTHWKNPDAGKDWWQEEKQVAEDEMVGWHHQLNGHEFEQTLGDGEGQRNLACCSPWGHKELDMT